MNWVYNSLRSLAFSADLNLEGNLGSEGLHLSDLLHNSLALDRLNVDVGSFSKLAGLSERNLFFP